MVVAFFVLAGLAIVSLVVAVSAAVVPAGKVARVALVNFLIWGVFAGVLFGIGEHRYSECRQQVDRECPRNCNQGADGFSEPDYSGPFYPECADKREFRL